MIFNLNNNIIMKRFVKSLLVLSICTFVLTTTLLGQDLRVPEPILTLTNYTVPLNEKSGIVGEFFLKTGQKVEIKIDKSGLFEIVNGNQLKLKKGKLIDENSPMIFPITVVSDNVEKIFELVKDEFIKNKVIAHRGAWKHSGQAQNSRGSLNAGIALGCEAVEFDVWLSKDGVVVLNHDNDLDGMIVEKTNLNKLLKVELANGEKIPTLQEYLDIVKKQNKTRLVMELKSNNNLNALLLVDEVIKIINENHAQAWVDYISFDLKALLRLRAYDNTAHLAYLHPGVNLDLLKLDGINGIDYHYNEYDKIDRLVKRCNILGLTTNVWTVNTESLMKTFLDLNVDFITTDEPELLLKLINNK